MQSSRRSAETPCNSGTPTDRAVLGVKNRLNYGDMLRSIHDNVSFLTGAQVFTFL